MSEQTRSAGAGAGDHPGGGPGHIVPTRQLAAVLGALLILTVLTVLASWVDLGGLNLWVAMIIATAKGSLVVLFFMHLYWDRPILGIVFISALLLVTLFIGLSLTDREQYSPDLIPGYAPHIQHPS
jgi:cytochrome c oxidase subunit 4